MQEKLINPTFSWLFEDNPIGDAIRKEIEDKVTLATLEKDEEIEELQKQIDELTTTILMGDDTNA